MVYSTIKSEFKAELTAEQRFSNVITIDGVSYYHKYIGNTTRSYRAIMSGKFYALSRGKYVDEGPYIIYGPMRNFDSIVQIPLPDSIPLDTPQQAYNALRLLNLGYENGIRITKNKIISNIFAGIPDV